MSLPATEHVDSDGFRLRGLSVSRVDAFSDVVFGFALTLLVVSLDVPKTYTALHQALRGFVPFALCFTLLMTVWHAHYKFFRRFGMHDTKTIVINATMLFVVLFYVYPLKFMFTVASDGLFGGKQEFFSNQHQVTEMMVLYGFGFAAVYFLLASLYANGLRQRESLQLSGLEQLLARGYMTGAVAVGSVGLLSALAAWLLPPVYSGLAGFLYMLVWGSRVLMRRLMRRRVARFNALHKLTDTPRVSAEKA